jgi:hypothetical protein
VALQALDKLVEVSEEIFGVTSDRWIRRAKEFIIHGPETKFKENHLFPERAFNKQKSKL